MVIVLPDNLKLFFTDYLTRLQRFLPGSIHGCYLYGSVALGAYDAVKSDLDFMVVLTAAHSEETMSLLNQFHIELFRDFPLAHKLEGHYVPLADIQRGTISQQYPGIADGQYQGLQGIMTLYWYQLHTCAIRIAGPEPETLFPPVPWELVQQEMDTNINGYWYRCTQLPEDTVVGDGAIEFAVLTLCRILYTLEHQQIIAKADAGRWAIQHLPATWHRLIEEAVRIRTGKDTRSLYTSPQQRTQETRQFILDMREQCNRQYFSR